MSAGEPPLNERSGAGLRHELLAKLQTESLRKRETLHPRDVFICHASADKDQYALPLEQAFRARALSVWIDVGQVAPGDSLVSAVGQGLELATVVVVLITQRFLDRKWPEKELNSALAKEISSGSMRVVPILDIPEETAFRRYPLLREKLCMSWNLGVEAIAEKLADRFGRRAAEWHVANHAPAYVGPVWTRVMAQSNRHAEPHLVTLLWGPYRFTKEIRFLGAGPLSLLHHKTRPNNLPLYIQVVPPAIVTVGQGPPPDDDQLPIDEGWVRIEGAVVTDTVDDPLVE